MLGDEKDKNEAVVIVANKEKRNTEVRQPAMMKIEYPSGVGRSLMA